MAKSNEQLEDILDDLSVIKSNNAATEQRLSNIETLLVKWTTKEDVAPIIPVASTSAASIPYDEIKSAVHEEMDSYFNTMSDSAVLLSDKTLAEQLLSSGTSTETLLALLLQEQINTATKNLPTFDIPKPIRKGRHNGMQTVKVHFNVGRKERMAPNFILGALVEATGLSGSEFGKIDIYDKYTTVEVPVSESASIIDAMQTGKINGHPVHAKLHEERGGNYHSNSRNGNSRSGNFRKNREYNRNHTGTYNRKKRRG